MAETHEDKAVDALISALQSTLDKLKAAQGKDVTDEDSEESSETSSGKDNRADAEQPPSTLKEAGARHQRMLAAQKK